MNRSLRAVLCIASFCWLLTASQVVADDEADHEALRKLVKEYEMAIKNADPSVLKPYLAHDFTGVMVTGEKVDSFDSLNAYWQKVQGLLGKGGTYRVKVIVPQVATIVGDLALSHGTTEDTVVTSDGKEYRFQGFWTAICRRENDGWKIVRLHGSMDAITNSFATSAIKAASLFAGILGGAVGFLLGAILFWILGRRRSKLAGT